MSDKPVILAVMLFPPHPESHGGSQRAWYLTAALARLGSTHLVLIHPTSNNHVSTVDLTPLRRIAASVTPIAVPEWNAVSHIVPIIPRRVGRWLDVWRIGSVYTPRLGGKALARIASLLPVRSADILFAGRLTSAVILDQMMDRRLLRTDRKVVDFDDVQSSFLTREIEADRKRWLPLERWLLERVIVRMVRDAEARIAAAWDAVSVCSDEDVAVLSRTLPDCPVVRVPNVVDKALLGPPANRSFTLLFVGNMGFGPNAHGLGVFLREAWPAIRTACPAIRMMVVGLNLGAALKARLEAVGIEPHSDVPSVAPFYAESDAVVAPILFGGGTRVKIIEAMAYGRPVVSTTLGVEGLGVVPGEHALVADDMTAFAAAVVSLALDPALGPTLARNARLLQERRFGPAAMAAAVSAMIRHAPARVA